MTENEHTSSVGKPQPPEQFARDLAHSPRPLDGEAFAAHPGDPQKDVRVSAGERVDPPDAVAIALGAAMRKAQEPWQEAPIDALDAELLALIEERASGDAGERARLVASAKRYPAVREALRNPSRYATLSVPAPDFSRVAE